ncbi:hypothetical protein [uncultured Microbacterium sp.]|nr:hypothetical protein [uncultured Microbacterium sp.]
MTAMLMSAWTASRAVLPPVVISTMIAAMTMIGRRLDATTVGAVSRR